MKPWVGRVPEEFQVGPQVYKPEETTEGDSPEKESDVVSTATVTEQEDDEHEFAQASASEKEAMARWKSENPETSLKLQRRLLERGVIKELPWLKYLKPKEDFVDEAAVEAQKWAEEHPEAAEAKEAKEWAEEKMDERPGDYIRADGVGYMENVDGHQVKKTIEGYTQNAEQNESTIWQRVKKAKGE